MQSKICKSLLLIKEEAIKFSRLLIALIFQMENLASYFVKLTIYLILGVWIWDCLGLDTKTVFLRAVYLTIICICFASAVAHYLNPVFFAHFIMTLRAPPTWTTSPDFTKQIFDTWQWSIAGLMTSFWVNYSFLKNEYVSKFTALRNEHDQFPDRELANIHHLRFHLDKLRIICVPDNVILNWCEDCLLFNLHEHESFNRSFEQFFSFYLFYLDQLEEIKGDDGISFERKSYPAMHKFRKNLCTKQRNLFIDEAKKISEQVISDLNSSNEINNIYIEPHGIPQILYVTPESGEGKFILKATVAIFR